MKSLAAWKGGEKEVFRLYQAMSGRWGISWKDFPYNSRRLIMSTLSSRIIIDENRKSYLMIYDENFLNENFQTCTKILIDAGFHNILIIPQCAQLRTIMGIVYNNVSYLKNMLN